MLLAFECGGKLFRVIFAIFINKVHLEYVLLTLRLFGYFVVPIQRFRVRTQKSVGTFSVYSYSRVFGVTRQQNNQKPTPCSVSISTVFLLLSYQSPNFLNSRIKLKRFSNMFYSVRIMLYAMSHRLRFCVNIDAITRHVLRV